MTPNLSVSQAFALRLAYHSRPLGAKLRMSVTRPTVDALVNRGLVVLTGSGHEWAITEAGLAVIVAIGESGARP